MCTRLNVLLILLVAPFFALSQQPYRASVSGSKILIHGTSNIHDWTSWVDGFSSKASLTVENGQLSGIDALTFTVPVRKIKSGKDAMDSNTYEALKADKHPSITYKLLRVNSMSPVGDRIRVETIGELTIAGIKRVIPLTVMAKPADQQITFTGKSVIKMTDFKVEPPTALFGTVATGDLLTIEFKILMNTQTSYTP